MGQLDGKTAIVTGATSGIGARIAEMFVEQGARVLAAGRRTEEGQALVARCGNAMTFLRTDVTDEASIKALVDRAVATFERLDCLVNNAGSGSPMVGIADVKAADFATVFATNVLGPMLGMKYAAPIMAKQGGGSHCHGERRGPIGDIDLLVRHDHTEWTGTGRRRGDDRIRRCVNNRHALL